MILAPALGLGQGGALMLALLAAALTATIQLMLKAMGRNDSADTLVAWNLILSVPLAAIPAAPVLDPADARRNGRSWPCRE